MSSVSDSAHPEQQAFRELEQLVRGLGDELGRFRARALQAEARLKVLEGGETPIDPMLTERVAELERENSDLRARLEAARTRTRQMLERVRFLRQQHARGGAGGPGAGSER